MAQYFVYADIRGGSIGRLKLLLLLSIINDDDCSVRKISVSGEMDDKSNLSTANTSTDVTDIR